MAERPLIPYPPHEAMTAEQLASQLLDNGLQGIAPDDLANRIQRVGYYRLKGYWYPFLTPTDGNPSKRKLPFRQNTNFNDIWERYVFDQELRVVVFDGIITIEAFLRSFLGTKLALFHGPSATWRKRDYRTCPTMAQKPGPPLSQASSTPTHAHNYPTSDISERHTAIPCHHTGCSPAASTMAR